jgi:hypothetical protein
LHCTPSEAHARLRKAKHATMANLLVELIGKDPGAAQDLADERLALAHLRSYVAQFDPNGKSGHLLDEFPRAEEAFGLPLASAYLAVVPVGEWDDRVGSAPPVAKEDTTEWVTLLEPRGDGRGISLPDDSGNLIGTSLFVDLGSETRRVGVVWHSGGRTSVTLGTSHCGEPVRGVCQTGSCGECEIRKVEGRQRSVTCRCPHDGARSGASSPRLRF